VNHLLLQVGVRFHFERGKADLTRLPTVTSLEIEGSSVRLPIKHPQTTFSAVKLRIKELRSVTEFHNVTKLSIAVYDEVTLDLSCLVRVEELEIIGVKLKNYQRQQNLKKAAFITCKLSSAKKFVASVVCVH
jgi:hypothetical protein